MITIEILFPSHSNASIFTKAKTIGAMPRVVSESIIYFLHRQGSLPTTAEIFMSIKKGRKKPEPVGACIHFISPNDAASVGKLSLSLRDCSPLTYSHRKLFLRVESSAKRI